jgi:general secretion pathway protein C
MRLVLDARGRALLRRIPRTNVYSAFELLLLAVLAVQCARLVWSIVTPVGPLGDWRPARADFAGSPSAVLQGFDPFFRLNGENGAPAIVTSLQLTLFGTRLDEAMGGGSAIIAGPDGVQQSVPVGQEIMPGVRLKAVSFDHVTIDRGGAEEDLFIAQGDPANPGAAPISSSAPSGAPAAANGSPAPPARDVGRGITIAQLRSDIGFIPRVDGGRVSGLVVRPQGTGGAFRQAGLHEGDIVTAIDGRAISGPNELDRLGAHFAKGGNLSITIERGGQTLPLVITIAGQ